MKKLYQVTGEVTSYVVAENEREAEKIIERKVDEELGSWFISACLVKSPESIEGSWKNCIPWREKEEDDDRTVEDWLKENKEEENKEEEK